MILFVRKGVRKTLFSQHIFKIDCCKDNKDITYFVRRSMHHDTKVTYVFSVRFRDFLLFTMAFSFFFIIT